MATIETKKIVREVQEFTLDLDAMIEKVRAQTFNGEKFAAAARCITIDAINIEMNTEQNDEMVITFTSNVAQTKREARVTYWGTEICEVDDGECVEQKKLSNDPSTGQLYYSDLRPFIEVISDELGIT